MRYLFATIFVLVILGAFITGCTQFYLFYKLDKFIHLFIGLFNIGVATIGIYFLIIRKFDFTAWRKGFKDKDDFDKLKFT
jgi:hypothetical protein